MHSSKTVFLLNDKVRAVLCAYEEDKPNQKTALTMFKTLNQTIEPGDLVVVPTNRRHNATVVRVKAVDVDPDYDNATPIDWIIDKVDMPRHREILVAEEKMIQASQKAQADRKRRELLGDLGVDAIERFKGLDMVSLPKPGR